MSNEHTPTTELVSSVYVQYMTRRGDISVKQAKEGFYRFLAAAEQRGAIKALRDVEGSLIDWDVIYGYEEGTAEDRESHRIAAWIGRCADQIEGDK